MCLSGSFDSQFVHLIKLLVKKNFRVYSSTAVIVGFCPGVAVYKGITMVLSLFRSRSWLVVAYCLVFCSGSCEPVHLDRTNSCSKEHCVCVYSSFLMWKKRNSWSIGNIDRSMCCYCKNESYLYLDAL